MFDNDSMTVIGHGTVDLQSEELDFSIDPSSKRGLGLSGVGKVNLNLGELAKPLKLTGTLRNPSIAVDASRSAITIGKGLGGMLLFGPLGLMTALAGGADGQEDPCLCAIQSAENRYKFPQDKKSESRRVDKEEGNGVATMLKGALDGANNKLKTFFSGFSRGEGNEETEYRVDPDEL
jgi:hypothetical protein